jgi:peptide/nickel transport system permease protein
LRRISAVADISVRSAAERKRHSEGYFMRLLKEKPLGVVGAVITLLLLLTGIFADFLAPYGMNETNVEHILAPPSAKFWLGTDTLGRDVLSRVIYGARISVIVGLSASTVATVLNLIIGGMSGYIGGKFDLIVQRVVDIAQCFPGIIISMVLISVIGPGLWQVTVVLGLLWGVRSVRLLRSATIAIRENAYVAAAVAAGCSSARIIIRHILPNILAPTIVLFSMRVSAVILTEASLSFLGYGIPPPHPSWGGMLSGMGRSHMLEAPWMVIWPGLALTSVVYGTNMFGDALRDILDPRLRGGVGRFGASLKR